MTEGLNIMMRVGASNFDDEGDADSMTEMSETDQGGIRRKRREHDAGASSVTTRKSNFNPDGAMLYERLSRGNSTPVAAPRVTTLTEFNIMNRRIRNRTYGGVRGRRPLRASSYSMCARQGALTWG